MLFYMSLIPRKPVFGVSNIVRLKPASETSPVIEFQMYRQDMKLRSRQKGTDQTLWNRVLICTFIVCRIIMVEYIAHVSVFSEISPSSMNALHV